MAEEKELARLAMRMTACDDSMIFDGQVHGSGKGILLCLAKMVNQVADNIGVSSEALLTFLFPLCKGLRKDTNSVVIDMGAVEQAMGRDDG